jgi:hypothetical protein
MDREVFDVDVNALRAHLTSYLYGMRPFDEQALASIDDVLEPFAHAPHAPRTWGKAVKVRDLFAAYQAQRPLDRRFDQRTIWKLKVAILQLCAAVLQLDKASAPVLRSGLRLVARDGERVSFEP